MIAEKKQNCFFHLKLYTYTCIIKKISVFIIDSYNSVSHKIILLR